MLSFSAALFAVALGVTLTAAAFTQSVSPIALAAAQAVLVAGLAAPLALRILLRGDIDSLPPQARMTTSASPHRLVRAAFLLTLTLLTGSVLIGAHTQRTVTGTAVAAAELVGTAGRQRTLSQVIAREATAPPNRRDRARLSAAIRRMRGEATSVDVAVAAMQSKNPRALRELREQMALAESSRAQLLAAALVLASGADSSRESAALVEARADRFLPAMEKAVTALETVTRSDITSGEEGALASFLAVLLLIALAGVVVVEPVIRLVRRQHLRAEQRAAALEIMSTAAQRTSNAVVFTDKDRRITWVNDAFTRITGYTLDEAIGMSPGALLQCERSDPATRDAMRAALHAELPFRGELLNAGKSGREYWLDIDIQPIRNNDGVLTGFCAIETDVTEQVAERQRLTSIFETLSEGVILVRADGVFLEWNAAAERILGVTGAQLAARSPVDAQWGSITLDGQTLEGDAVPLMRTLRTGEVYRDFVHGITLPDGTLRWLSVSTAPIRSADGAIASVVASFSDVTELRANVQRLELIVNAAGLGTFDWHVPSGDVQYNDNVGLMLGIQPAAMAPRIEAWESRLHPDDREQAWQQVSAALDGRVQQYRCEHRLQREDGTWAWIIGVGRVTERSSTGEPLRLAGVNVDISAAKESELSARLAQERFEAAAAGTSDGLWDWNVHSEEIWLSPRCWTLLGYANEACRPAATRAAFVHDIHPDDRDAMLGALASLLKQGTDLDRELRLRLQSGEYRWFRLRCAVERGDTGAPRRLAGAIQDITDARSAEQALVHARQEAETALREVAALRTALDEHSILSIADRAGRILDVNTGFCAISGFTREELIGADHRILNSGVHPKAFWVNVWRTISSGKAWRGEVCNRRRDGTEYWVDSTIVPYVNGEGKVEKYVSIRFDISTQKAAEAELQRATALLEEAQLVARIGSWSFDLATGQVAWSKQIYALFGRDETLGPPDVHEIMSDYDDEASQALQEAIARTADTGEPYSLVLGTRHGHDGVRYVRALGQARLDTEGKVTGMFGTVADVTAEIERGQELQRARRAAEDAGARLQEMNAFLEGETVRANDMAARAELASHSKSEFLANMSHEIRTPLTAILGYTDILAEEAPVDDASQRRVSTLQTIRRAGEHLLTVINDVLDLSKIDSGAMVIERVETDLPRILLDVDSLMHSRAAAKGVLLNTSLTTPVPNRIWSDPTRLRQILLNLVGNAAKFTQQGHIDVLAAVVPPGDDGVTWLRLTVRDTGPGMTAARSALLFQPFQQGDTSVTREHGGTGLGLTICRRLARAMGGDARLESSEPGRGSCFVVEVPLEAHDAAEIIDTLREHAPASPSAAASETSALVKPLHGRILLAEDGEDNQRLIAFHLERAGADVTVVANGRLALDELVAAAAAGEPYGLLVTDMQMPVMDGYTLARTLRVQRSTVPVIALTAHAMPEDRQRCLDAGCDDYATKPIDKRQLIAVCTQWLGVTRDVQSHDVMERHDDIPGFPDGASRPDSRAASFVEPPVGLPGVEHAVLHSELLDDPDMRPLVDAFLQVLADRLAQIEANRHAEHRGELRSLAHQLKGAAGGYGFPAITEAARTLERFAAAGGTQHEVDTAIATLGNICQAALRGGVTPADTPSSTVPSHAPSAPIATS